MADNVEAASGSGGPIFATDDDGVAHHPYTKMEWGADNTQTKVGTGANALPIQDGGNTITVDGTVTANLSATDNAVLDQIELNTDPLLVVGGGLEATAQRVTLASDSTGVLSVDDNGGSLTVDGTVTANLAAGDNNVGNVDVVTFPTEAHSADYDTGAGTDTTLAFGIAVPASGGAAVVPGDATAGLKVDLGADNDVTVTSGSITANAGTNLNTSSLALETGGNLATLAGAVTGTEVQVDVVAALPAGTNAIGKLAANSGVDIGDVDVTSIAAGTNTIGDVGLATRTSGGVSVYYDNDLDETSVAVKGSAGQIYFIHAINLHTAPLYLQLFNIAQGSVTVGTTTPTMQFVIPSAGDANGAGFTMPIPQGIAFSTAITAAATTNSEGNGAPGTNLCHVNIGYA